MLSFCRTLERCVGCFLKQRLNNIGGRSLFSWSKSSGLRLRSSFFVNKPTCEGSFFSLLSFISRISEPAASGPLACLKISRMSRGTRSECHSSSFFLLKICQIPYVFCSARRSLYMNVSLQSPICYNSVYNNICVVLRTEDRRISC